MRWLIATDLDGTLFDHTLQPTARVRAALAAVQAAGHHLTLATGRMFRATAPIAASLHIAEPLICYQGAMVRQGDTLLHHRTLSLEVSHAAIRLAGQEGLHLNAYVDDQLFVAEATPEARFYTELNPGVPLEVVGELGRFLTREPTKLVFVLPDAAAADRCLTLATARWGAVAQVVRSHPRFVELTHPAASKGAALLALAQRLALPRERVLAVGDNLNDLSMIRAAAIGVAMGDGAQALREAADWVAPPLAEDGLAVALEQWLRGAGALEGGQ